jgi:hypothetical protein
MRIELARLVPWTTARLGAICAVVAIAAACAYIATRPRPHVGDSTPIRHAPATEFAARGRDVARDLEDLQGENGRLKKALAVLQGKTAPKPDTIIQYDTVIAPPDTILLPGTTIDGDGQANVLRGVKDSIGYKPELAKRIDVKDCDDGLAFDASGIVCNKARLGHVSVIARFGVSRETDGTFTVPFAAGVRWDHTFRSTLSFEIMADAERRLTAQASIGVRVF